MDMPLVDPKDDGIRPAGRPDQCLYCKQMVGQPHLPDCVVVTKKVKLRYIFEVVVEMPHSWSKESILFSRNEGSRCADNTLDELEQAKPRDEFGVGCLCPVFTCEFIEVVDDTPTRKLRD